MQINFVLRAAGLLATVLLIAGCGGGGGSDNGNAGNNQPPRANAATATLDEDTEVQSSMTGVATDGGTLSFNVQTQPSNGGLAVSGANYTYTPDPDFFGTDRFTFIVSESGRSSAPATVTLNVTGVNDAPTAVDSNATTDEDSELAQSVAATDVDGDTLTLAIATPTTNGTVSAGVGTQFTYMPAANFFGTDSFTFTVSDGIETTALATMTIEVAPVNDVPVLSSATLNLVAGTGGTVDMTGTDIENDSLTYRLTDNFDQAAVSNDPVDTGLFDVVAAYGTYGTDQATVVANDGTDDSAPATIELTIQVPATTANVTFDVYDGELATLVKAVDEGPDGTIYVTGTVRGVIADPSPDDQFRTFLALHDETGVRNRVVYFDDLRIVDAATGFNGDLFTATGSRVDSPLTVRTVSLDANGDPDLDASATAPYTLNRTFKHLEFVHIQGTGFYAIANDNQVHLISYSGAVVSSITIPAPISDGVFRYEALDVRIVDNQAIVAGGLFTCADNDFTCNGGINDTGFVLRLDLSGNPLEIMPLPDFPRDVAILGDGRVVAHIGETLQLFDTDGSLAWQRSISGATLGLVGSDAADNIYWWAYDRVNTQMTATRITVGDALIWQSTSPITVLGALFTNDMHVDAYGNLFVSLIEQYNLNGQALGRLVNVHVNYAGTWQWTEFAEPGDIGANGTDRTGKSLLSSGYRLVSIATDIRNNVDEPDSYAFFNAISPAPPAP